MTETELRQAYEDQKPALQAWGVAVQDAVVAGLRAALSTSRRVDDFLKVPALCRVKDTESFLAKALRRGKSYERPLVEIIDRVGVRFVVLLRTELAIIEAVIEECDLWEAEKARDFEAEATERPHHFDYQSNHYIIRTKRPTDCGGVSVPAGTPCEVQVRTLLQHAYAELAHDTTYKTSLIVDPDVLREIAKAAALVETTDQVFDVVKGRIEGASAEIRRAHEMAAAAYERLVGTRGSDDIRLSYMLLDRCRSHLAEMSVEALAAFLNDHDFIADKIRERAPLSVFFRHPSVLVIYFLVAHDPDSLPGIWPCDAKHLEFIYTDLGLSTEGRLW